MTHLRTCLVSMGLIATTAAVMCGQSTDDGIFRTWTDSSGRFSVSAKLVETDDDTITLQKRDGSNIHIPIARLSAADRMFIADQGATNVPNVAAEGSVDLLALIDLERETIKGNWHRANGVLSVKKDKALTLLVIPFEPTGDYTMTAKVRRNEGAANLIMGFVMNGRRATVHLDHYPNKSAVQTIDGKLANDNESTVQNDASLFVNGKTHEVVYRVDEGQVSVRVDGKKVFAWKGDADRLATPSHLGVESNNSLFVGSYGGAWSIQSLTLAEATTPVAEAIATTPDVLREEAKNDRKAAIAKYRDKPILLTGVVDGFNVTDDGSGTSAFVIVTPEKDSREIIACRVSKPWEMVSVGDEVSIYGVGDFSRGATRLIDAKITSPKGTPTRRVSAKELVDSFVKDKDASHKTYDDQVVIVEGTVVDVLMGKDVPLQHILLAGNDSYQVRFGLHKIRESQTQFGGVKVGDTIAVLGQVEIDKYTKMFPVSISIHYVYNIAVAK